MAAVRIASLVLLLSLPAAAQETRDLGLPPPSGSQNPVLPPASGYQNPVLPPPSGQRYMPGSEGRWRDPPAGVPPVPAPRTGTGGGAGIDGTVAPDTPVTTGSLDRIADIPSALRRCWDPPAIEEPGRGVMATVRFSLRRDGTLFGQPRVAWESRVTDPALRERFSASIVAAVRECTPMRLSPGLGAAIAGRPFTIRFHGRGPSNERTI